MLSSKKSLGGPPDNRQKTKGHKVVDERSEGVVEWGGMEERVELCGIVVYQQVMEVKNERKSEA